MATLLELAAGIVASHASVTEMSTEELLAEIKKVFTTLKRMEDGTPAPEADAIEPATTTPSISLKKAFQADQVICMICGKTGMKTLARHLAQNHQMKPGAYRKQFGIPASQPLTAKKFSESRRQMADQIGLAANLAKAREVRAAKLQEKKATPPPEKKARGRKKKE